MQFTPRLSNSGQATWAGYGQNLYSGNVINSPKLSEKTIELTASAQFGHIFQRRMVWFGLTQSQERNYGFDAAASLGGHAFILQFKVSNQVMKRVPWRSHRKFQCQHHQMQALVSRFRVSQHACFYFLPDIGTVPELINVNGDLLGNSYLADISSFPNTIPTPHRSSNMHYAYLDSTIPALTITSDPFEVPKLIRASDFAKLHSQNRHALTPTERLIDLYRRINDTIIEKEPKLTSLFFRNASLCVILDR